MSTAKIVDEWTPEETAILARHDPAARFSTLSEEQKSLRWRLRDIAEQRRGAAAAAAWTDAMFAPDPDGRDGLGEGVKASEPILQAIFSGKAPSR